MTLWTWSDIQTKVKNDLDLNDETMISDTEMMAYGNEAVSEAEKHLLGINEDYLLQSTTLSLVSGTSEYDLPSNIYAHKIRKVFYDDGSNKYEIKRIRKLAETPDIEDDEDYRYLIYMNSSGEFKFKLFPASRVTSSSYVTIWFIGNANTITSTATTINIPEAAEFIVAKVKLACLRKEMSPGQVAMEEEVERQRQLMIETLEAMVPDEDNEVLLDFSFYEDHV